MNCRKRRQAVRYRQEGTVLKMEPMSRIELLTYALRKRCSTTELRIPFKMELRKGDDERDCVTSYIRASKWPPILKVDVYR